MKTLKQTILFASLMITAVSCSNNEPAVVADKNVDTPTATTDTPPEQPAKVAMDLTTAQGFWDTYKKAIAAADETTLQQLYSEEQSVTTFKNNPSVKAAILSSIYTELTAADDTYKEGALAFNMEEEIEGEEELVMGINIYIMKNDKGNYQVVHINYYG